RSYGIGERLLRVRSRFMIAQTADRPAPYVTPGVDRRMQMMQHIAAILVGAELPRRRDGHLHARHAGALQRMRMYAVDHLVAEPVGEKRRLLIVVRVAN